MKKIISLILVVTLAGNAFAQSGLPSPPDLGDTYKINLYKDKCTDGKCKEGGTGTLRFKDYGDIKDFTGSFGEDGTFSKGLLRFNNGDVYEGTFKLIAPANKYAHPTVEYDSGTFTKKDKYKYTAKFLNNMPSGNTEVIFTSGANYKGSVKSGWYDGYGEMTFADGGYYKGNYKDGYYAGKGKIQYKTGLVYEGDWVKDKRDGKGVFTNVNEPGYYFSGPFKDNYPNGQGKILRTGSPDTMYGEFYNGYQTGFFEKRGEYQFYKTDTLLYDHLTKVAKGYCISGNCVSGTGKMLLEDGALYEGDVKNGMAEGKGKTIFKSGIVYTGNYAGSEMSGKGKMLWTDGSSYDGDWAAGKRTGKGIYKWVSGSVYEGDWVNGNREGKGRLVLNDSSSYDGSWKNDTKDGKGKYIWGEGEWKNDSYNGDWENDARTGKGVYHSNNGNKYEGGFYKGQYAGAGTFTYASGGSYTSNNWDSFSFTSGTYKKSADAQPEDGMLKDNRFLNAAAQAAAAYADKNPGLAGTIPVAKRIADMNSGKAARGPNITHAAQTVNFARDRYSVIMNWRMLSSYATGFKRYYIVAGAGGKKYPLPFGVHITFEFVNSKGELVKRQSVGGYDLEGSFDAPEDGEYTIQAKYDFEGCINCRQEEYARMTFTLLSIDYTYKQ